MSNVKAVCASFIILSLLNGFDTSAAPPEREKGAGPAHASAIEQVDVIAKRVAAKIEDLKEKHAPLIHFSAVKHTTKTPPIEGFLPGTPNNPEFYSIAYANGVLGNRPPARGGRKRSIESIFDPKFGVQLYVHFFNGNARGNDMRPSEKIGDLSVHLYVQGPAAKEIRGDILKILDKVRVEFRENRLIAAQRDDEDKPDAKKETDAVKIQQWTEQLSSSDGTIRGVAAFQLGLMGEQAITAIPQLILQFGDLLAPVVDPSHDHGTQISVVAINAVAQIGTPAVEPLMDAMRNKQTRQDRRACCAVALGKIKDPRAIDPLIEMLSDDYQGLRLQAAMALRQIGSPALNSLKAVVDDRDVRVRLGATQALQDIAGEHVATLLIERLEDSDHQVRSAAARALAKRTSDESVIDALIRSLQDSNDEVRSDVFAALCHCRDPRLLDHFLAGMNDSHPVVRWRSAEALGAWKSDAALEALLDALKSDDDSLRSGAARSLGRMGDKRALDVLVDLARHDASDEMRVVAGRAIGELEYPEESYSDVVWGKAVEGIQLGLRCDSGPRPYRIGEVIRFERMIRNQSDRPWKFRIEMGGRTAADITGRRITLHSGHEGGGNLYPHTMTVAAGEVGLLDSDDFKIQAVDSALPSPLSILALKPGTYVVTTRLDRSGFAAQDKPDLWTKLLTAGEYELAIRDDQE